MCVKNNALPVESHCGIAENATDNYTVLPKSMAAGRAPREGELAGGQVTVTPITSLGCSFSPQLPGCGLGAQARTPSPWACGGFSVLSSFGRLEEGGELRDTLLSALRSMEPKVAHPA